MKIISQLAPEHKTMKGRKIEIASQSMGKMLRKGDRLTIERILSATALSNKVCVARCERKQVLHSIPWGDTGIRIVPQNKKCEVK